MPGLKSATDLYRSFGHRGGHREHGLLVLRRHGAHGRLGLCQRLRPRVAQVGVQRCTGLASLDLTGLDPSAAKDWFYCFAGCGNLATIYVDSTWALPSGASGLYTFYNCTSIVGGNGTAYSSSNTSYAYVRVDSASVA